MKYLKKSLIALGFFLGINVIVFAVVAWIQFSLEVAFKLSPDPMATFGIAFAIALGGLLGLVVAIAYLVGDE